MSRAEQGFSHVILLVAVVLLAVATSGYVVYLHQHDKVAPANMASTTTSSKSSTMLSIPTNTSNTASGVTTALNSLANSLNTSEASANVQANASDQSSDANVGTAATNLGGAYDAGNY